MTNLAKAAGLASCASLALAVAACDNETTAENQVEAQADALRQKGDAIEDHLKNEADEMGDDTARMSKADQPKD